MQASKQLKPRVPLWAILTTLVVTQVVILGAFAVFALPPGLF